MGSDECAYCDLPLEDHIPTGDCPGYLVPPAPYTVAETTELTLDLESWDDADHQVGER